MVPSAEELPLKALPGDQLRVLELQAIDTRTDQLRHRERTLPESASLREIDDRLAALQDDVVIAQTSLTDLTRAVTRAEEEVQQVRRRAARDQELLESGSITSSKQLEELQKEVASLARRQSALEDAELEVMEEAEQAQNSAVTLAAAIAEAQQLRDEVAARRDIALAAIRAELADATGERDVIAGALDAELLKLYTKLRADNGGVGAALLRGDRCEGCHMQLPPTELANVTGADPDEVQRCDECRRILIRITANQ